MRKAFVWSASVLAAAVMVVGCKPSRPSSDAGFDSGILPCTNCPPADGGTDGGTGDGGTGDGGPGDGGTFDGGMDGGVWIVTIDDLRGTAVPFGTRVILGDVVITAVSFDLMGDAGAGNPGPWRSEFWVTDPANPEQGIWVRKFYTDPPDLGRPTIGDRISVEGWFGTESRFTDRHGYRRVVKNQFDFLPAAERPDAGPLVIEKSSEVTPPEDNMVLAGSFGDAVGGTVRTGFEHAGARVHVQGPVEIVDPSPQAFKRISANPADAVYFGFEITGGILVNNYKTFTTGGGCPWRDDAIAAAANGEKVVFNGGVKGVWDSFTHAPCADGGTASNCFRNDGLVPGSDAGWIFVLYPQTCDDFVDPEIVAQ